MSSGPELSVQLSLNDAKLLVGLANALKAQDKFTDGVGKTVDEAKKAEAELLKFANAAKRIDVTPQERYQKAIQQTDAALQKGLLTEEQANRARARAKADLDRLTQATDQLNTKQQGVAASSDRLSESLSASLTNVVQLASSYFSLSAAMAAVNQQIENKLNLEKEALTANLTVGAAQETLGLNLQDAKLFAQAVGEIEDIRQQTGFSDVAALTNATAEAVSAAGGNLPLALAGVRTAASVSALNPANVNTLAGAFIDASGASGASTDEAAALVLAAAKAGRVADLRLASKSIGKSLASVVATSSGDARLAAEQGAELFAGLSVEMKDPTGDRSATGVSSLARLLQNYYRENTLDDPGQLFGRIDALRQSGKMADFLAKNNFGEADPVIRRMLEDPESQQAKAIAAARRDVGYNLAGLQEVRQITTAGTNAIRTGREEAAFAGSQQALQLGDEPEALRAQIRSRLDKNIARFTEYTDLPIYAEQIKRPFNEYVAGKNIGDLAVADIKKRIDAAAAPTSLLGMRDTFTPTRKDESQFTAKERDDVAEMRKSLTELVELQKRLNRAEERDRRVNGNRHHAIQQEAAAAIQ